jgi:hypothetical protein
MNTEQIESAINIFENKFDNYAIGRMYTDLYPVKGIILAALRAQQERENPKSLSLDELKERVGSPVWVVEKNGNGWWGILVIPQWRNDIYIAIKGGLSRCSLDYGKTWLAYSHKPKQ